LTGRVLLSSCPVFSFWLWCKLFPDPQIYCLQDEVATGLSILADMELSFSFDARYLFLWFGVFFSPAIRDRFWFYSYNYFFYHILSKCFFVLARLISSAASRRPAVLLAWQFSVAVFFILLLPLSLINFCDSIGAPGLICLRLFLPMGRPPLRFFAFAPGNC